MRVLAISIHSPHTGRDRRRRRAGRNRSGFQSTLPTRGETLLLMATCGLRRGISIHSPHTGRDTTGAKIFTRPVEISIHSPHTGRDGYTGGVIPRRSRDFNPLSPHGERQGRAYSPRGCREFQSTLPTRGETCRDGREQPVRRNFNPLSPHGERPAPTKS